MKKYILAAFLLIFAAINPQKVSAETIEPPKVIVDGIVSIAYDNRTSLIQPLQLQQYKTFALAEVKIPTVTPRAAIPGNTYVGGNCTWYAKSKRPDLPNNLGDAKYWYERAKAQGIPTGTTPQVGAIGVAFDGPYGHVVYIDGIIGDQVHFTEMNWLGLGVVSPRTAPASSFVYIY